MKRTAIEREIIEQDNIEEESSYENNKADDAMLDGVKRMKMPKKNKHRMHAHINPFNALTIPVPKDPSFVDWSIHYPTVFGIPKNNNNKMVVNTAKYPITYDIKPEEVKSDKTPTVIDIGCGYGGLMFGLSKVMPENLILGQEIRDKVSNFVVEKINTIRNNTKCQDCANLAVVRTNSMKTFHNYFAKESVEKMFFCFADPHFKKANHRRRIINTALLTDYAYCLKPGGKIYTVTDVKQLHDWEVSKLDQHPMFERVSSTENDNDICVKIMREKTDEAIKVMKKEGNIWHAVFRKRDTAKEADKIDQSMLEFYL